MSYSFIRLTLRSIKNNRLYTLINVFGLSLGITVFLVIAFLIRYENSFNRDVPQPDRVYRIWSQFNGTFSGSNRGVTNALPPYLTTEYDIFSSHAHFHTWSADVRITSEETSSGEFENENGLVITNPGLLEVVGIWDWLAGDPEQFKRPHQLLLLQSQAEKYFGPMEPIDYLGREVTYSDSLTVEVAGILGEPMGRTDFQFTDFISSATIESSWLSRNISFEFWGSVSSRDQFFVRLANGVTQEDLEEVLDAGVEEIREQTDGDRSFQTTYRAQPVADLHFNTELGIFNNSATEAADREMLNILFIIALSILLIAVVNFVNLETAVAGRKAREIGIRKILGSQRIQLIFQILFQSTLVAAAAVILAIPLVFLTVKIFSEFLPDGLEVTLTLQNTLYLVLFTLCVGLLSGLYPSWIISSFEPVKVLKGNTGSSGRKMSKTIRKGLTVFQFTLSTVLLVLTMTMYFQLDYMLTKDLGFRTENVIYFSTPWHENRSKVKVIENELRRISNISEMTRYGSAPMERGWSSQTKEYQPEDGEPVMVEFFLKTGDSTYMDFFGIDLVAGRKPLTDREVVINRKALAAMGIGEPEEALGIIFNPKDSTTISGVVEDIHYRSLHHEIDPLMIRLQEGRNFGLKLADKQAADATLSEIESVYKEVYPDEAFNYYFMENSLRRLYEDEERSSTLVLSITGLALLISCMGLFGLSSFMAFQRVKEIGIRKVQGATSGNIIRLLSWDFIKLVLLALAIAMYPAWLASKEWLSDFAYRIEPGPSIFLFAESIAILIAFFTVSYHSFNASRINPARSLRME